MSTIQVGQLGREIGTLYFLVAHLKVAEVSMKKLSNFNDGKGQIKSKILSQESLTGRHGKTLKVYTI